MACGNCPEVSKYELEDVECLEGFVRVKDSEKCFNPIDVGMNLYCALNNIGEKVGLLVDAQEKKGFASAVLHFRVSARSYTNGVVIDTQFSRSPLNYKVTGFGVSCLTFPDSAGAYTNDDILKVKLFDFTSVNQIGNQLTLTKTQLNDKHTDEGNVIGPNIGNGHIYGVKVNYTNTDAGAFTGPDIDIYIHIEPTELITDI
jgi:hypothetical protein